MRKLLLAVVFMFLLDFGVNVYNSYAVDKNIEINKLEAKIIKLELQVKNLNTVVLHNYRDMLFLKEFLYDLTAPLPPFPDENEIEKPVKCT